MMDARDKIIEDLQKLVAKQSAEIAALRQEVAELKLGAGQSDKRLVNIIETAIQ